MKAFRVRGGKAVAILDAQERMVVARVVADVGLLLGGEAFGMGHPRPEAAAGDDLFAHLRGLEESLAEPEDPAILRLLPNAAPTDREVADEFRRLTEPDLRALKVGRLHRIWEQLSEEGPEWVVGVEEAPATAAALTDLRLVIASRLGLETDDDVARLHAEIDLGQGAGVRGKPGSEASAVDAERVWLGMLYEALTWLQDSLVAFVMDGTETEHEEGESDE